MNISGPKTNDQIALIDDITDLAMQRLAPGLIRDATMAVRRDLVDDRLAAHARYRFLARRIDIGDDDTVGVVESARRIRAEGLSCANIGAVETWSGLACAPPIEPSSAWRGSLSDDARNRPPAGTVRWHT